MILINEWLPNPTGADAAGEWVELLNNGNSSVNVSSWQIKNGSGSKTILNGQISSGEYLVLYRTKTKLTLKNTDERIFLYDTKGILIDQSSFLGSAPEGKSFSRVNKSGLAQLTTSDFTWSDPSPGTQNKISLSMGIEKNTYPTGESLNHPLGTQQIILMALGTGVVLTAIALFLIKRNNDLSKFFFGKN